MCNLYSMTTNVEAIRAFVRDMRADLVRIGNFEPQTAIFPDYLAPIVRNFFDGRELTKVRWGMPSSSVAIFEAAKKRAQKMQQRMGQAANVSMRGSKDISLHQCDRPA